MNEIAEAPKTQYIDVPVLKKSRRVLVFLADFFLTLMLTVTLFNLATYPLGKLVVGYDARISSLHQAQNRRDAILYDLALLFPKEAAATDYGFFETNLTYTCGEYIHGLVDSSYGSQYEVFRHYFVDIKGSSTDYVNFYAELDKNAGYFDIGDGKVTLKPEYVTSLSPKYNPDDSISSKGQADYENFENKIFAQGYQRLLSDAYETNLSNGTYSYKTEQSAITDILNGNLYLVSTCVLLSYLFSWLLFFMIVPSLNKNRKTLGMIVLKVVHVKKDNFDVPSLPLTYLQGAYGLLSCAGLLVFAPIGVMTFNELFSLPILFIVSIISLVFVLASLAMLLVDVYNRTLGDFFSQCYCLGEDEYDELAKKKVSRS